MSDATTGIPAPIQVAKHQGRLIAPILAIGGVGAWVAVLFLAVVSLLGLEVPEFVALAVVLSTVALSALSLPTIVQLGQGQD